MMAEEEEQHRSDVLEEGDDTACTRIGIDAWAYQASKAHHKPNSKNDEESVRNSGIDSRWTTGNVYHCIIALNLIVCAELSLILASSYMATYSSTSVTATFCMASLSVSSACQFSEDSSLERETDGEACLRL